MRREADVWQWNRERRSRVMSVSFGEGERTSGSGVRRDKAALSSGARPTRQPLQPEAIGAVMEVTKWL
jgi:hypothetical protein